MELWAPKNGRKEMGTWGYNRLGCIGDYTTALNGDYNKPLFWDPY